MVHFFLHVYVLNLYVVVDGINRMVEGKEWGEGGINRQTKLNQIVSFN